MQHMAATYREAIDHRDHSLRDRAYLFLQVEYIEPGHEISAYIAAIAAYILVAARAESLISRTSEDDDLYIEAIPACIHRVYHFLHREWRESIAVARTVDRDLCYSFIEIKLDLLVFLDGLPFSLCHISIEYLVMSIETNTIN